MNARGFRIAAVAAVLLAAGASLSAKTTSYDCTAAGGAFSQMTHVTEGRNPAISGNVQVKQLGTDSKVLPTATVRVSTKKDFVALQLTPERPDSQKVLVRVRNGTGAEEEFAELGTISLDQPISFRIDLLKNEVRVTAGDQSVTVEQMMRGNPTVALTCSTGSFQFADLSFG
jgi:hypothetical protein